MRTLVASVVALLLVLVTVGIAPTPAHAQTDTFEENIRIIQQRPFLRRNRVEVAPYFGLSLNDTLFLHLGAGVVANYHILENLFIGGSYVKYFSMERSLFETVEEDFRVYPEKWELDFYAGGHIAYVPIYGKFIFAGSAIAHYDVYVIAGAGVTRTSLSDTAVTGNVGVGTRFFLTRWLTLNFEVRDYIYQEEFKAGSQIVNNVVLQTGLSFFIPFGFDYRYPR